MIDIIYIQTIFSKIPEHRLNCNNINVKINLTIVLYLSYVQGNDIGSSLYESVGFKETGEIDHGEVVMSLDLTES